jgi:hypothetical protein
MVGLDRTGRPAFVIRDDLAVAIDMESWEFFSRATMLRLEEASACAEGRPNSMHIVWTTPQTLRIQLARPSRPERTNQGQANRRSAAARVLLVFETGPSCREDGIVKIAWISMIIPWLARFNRASPLADRLTPGITDGQLCLDEVLYRG